jgi:hypothetical protein
VREVQHLEAAGQTLGEAPLHEKRRRGEQHHAELVFGAGVFVPETLHCLGPSGDLLHFVERQHGAGGMAAERDPGAIPLRRDPGGVAQGRLVRRGVHRGDRGSGEHLLDQGGLADLARPGHDLEMAARLRQPVREDPGLRTLETGTGRFTHYVE